MCSGVKWIYESQIWLSSGASGQIKCPEMVKQVAESDVKIFVCELPSWEDPHGQTVSFQQSPILSE